MKLEFRQFFSWNNTMNNYFRIGGKWIVSPKSEYAKVVKKL